MLIMMAGLTAGAKGRTGTLNAAAKGKNMYFEFYNKIWSACIHKSKMR